MWLTDTCVASRCTHSLANTFTLPVHSYWFIRGYQASALLVPPRMLSSPVETSAVSGLTNHFIIVVTDVVTHLKIAESNCNAHDFYWKKLQYDLLLLFSIFILKNISGRPLSALTCCVNVRLLSAIKKISPLIYSQSWVGSWVYTTQAMMTFTLIF